MIQQKIKTFISLVKTGKILEIFRVFIKYFVKITKYYFVAIDLNTFIPGRFKATIPLEHFMAKPEDMKRLFFDWPDSKEEYDRHFQVYNEWGFEKCLLFFDSHNKEIVSFMFILTEDDIVHIKKYLH